MIDGKTTINEIQHRSSSECLMTNLSFDDTKNVNAHIQQSF